MIFTFQYIAKSNLKYIGYVNNYDKNRYLEKYMFAMKRCNNTFWNNVINYFFLIIFFYFAV